MRKSIKLILAILVLGIIVIIISKITTNNDEYYRNIADTVIGFYNSAKYDSSSIKDKDLPAVKEYLSTLTHIDEEICVSDYVVKQSAYKTNKNNSDIIYIKNNKCYVKYNDLNISKTDDSEDEEMESYDNLVCNGYYVTLYKSMFNGDYKDTIKNPKYNYIFKEYNSTKDTKEYTYTSSYDGTNITIILNIESGIIVKIENSNE